MKKLFLILIIFCTLSTGVFANWSLEDNMNATCRVSVSGAMGTGSVVNEDEQFYYVMTNGHVVSRLGANCQLEFYQNGYLKPKIPGRVIWIAFNRSDADVAIIRTEKSKFNFKPKKLELAPADTDLSKGTMIQGAGCPNGYWFQGWKCQIGRHTGTRIYFQMPPIGGQSGSAITLAGTNKVVGLVTWRLGGDSGSLEGAGVSIKLIQHLMGNSTIRNTFPRVKKPESIEYTPLEPDAIRVSEKYGVSVKDIMRGRPYPNGDEICDLCGKKYNDHVGKLGPAGKLYTDLSGKTNRPQLFCPVQCGPGGCNPYFYGSPYSPYGGNGGGQNPYGQNPYGEQDPYGNGGGQDPYGGNPYGQNPRNPNPNPNPNGGQGNLPDIFRQPPQDPNPPDKPDNFPPVFPDGPESIVPDDSDNPDESEPDPTPDLKAIQDALDSCKKDKEELQGQIDQLKSDKDGLNKKVDELNSELKNINNEYKHVQEMHKAEISIFKRTIESLEEKQTILIEKHSKLEKEYLLAVEKYKETISILEKEKSQISEEIKEGYESEISDLKNKLEEQHQHHGDFDKLQKQLDIIQSDLNDTKDLYRKSQDELQKAQDKVEEYKKQIDNYKNDSKSDDSGNSGGLSLFGKLKEKYLDISEKIRYLFEGGLYTAILGVVVFFAKKKTGPILDRVIDWAYKKRRRAAIKDRQKKNKIDDDSAYNSIEGNDLENHSIEDNDSNNVVNVVNVVNIDEDEDDQTELKQELDQLKQKKKSPDVTEPNDLPLEKRYKINHGIEDSEGDNKEEEEEEVSYQPVEYKVSFTPKTYVYELLALKQKDGESVQHIAAKGKLYREAVSLLRQGKLEHSTGTRITNAVMAADSIDDWVNLNFLGKATAPEIKTLKKDELVREALFGLLYQRAVEKLRAGDFQVLNNIAMANAIEKHVNNELLKYIRNQEV